MNAPQGGRITDIKERYKGGVLKYEQMGYWRPDDFLSTISGEDNLASRVFAGGLQTGSPMGGGS
jgi:hypothetical protein